MLATSQVCLLNSRDFDEHFDIKIVKRGCKYPEIILNESKTSTSIMTRCTAAGELLPLYVVYKAGKVWDTWTENGPAGTK